MKKAASRTYLNGWLLVAIVALSAVTPFYVMDGMFLDGATYSAIARNMHAGNGSFLQPYFSPAATTFYSHPPLVFGLLSLFYDVFGESFFVERFYALLIFLITVLLIRETWNQFSKPEWKGLAWIPVLLWLCTPGTIWGQQVVLLENTMIVFLMLAILCYKKAADKNAYFYLAGGSACVFLGFLSKGPVALFPLLFIFIYDYSEKRVSARTFIQLAVSLTIAVLFFCLPYFFLPEFRNYMDRYFEVQVLANLGAAEAIPAGNHFYLAGKLAVALLPSAVLCLLVTSIARRRNTGSKTDKRTVLIFLTTGLTASVPLLISAKQNTFYLLPSFPLFALAAAAWMAPHADALLRRMHPVHPAMTRIALFTLLAGAIVLNGMCVGKYSRDREMIEDVRKISEAIPPGTLLTPSPELTRNWTLAAYLARYGNIGMNTTGNSTYVIANKNETWPGGSSLTASGIALGRYTIYRK